MKRFTAIDWFNILFPIPLGVVMSYYDSTWWLMVIVAGILYGSYMWRMSAVVEELKQTQ